MALVLEYAPRLQERSTPWMPSAAFPILLIYAHINLCWQISRLMLEPVCNHVDPHFSAWTPVAWLPGSVTTLFAGSGWGTVVMFLMSVFAGRLMHGVISRYCLSDAWSQNTFRVGTFLHDWRVWLTAILWLAWVPVPSMLAFIYQFEVWAITR
jgi:hypothetical protein